MIYFKNRIVNISSRAIEAIKKKEGKDALIVGMHIRRTDYDSHLRRLNQGRQVDSEWHYRAIGQLKAKLEEQNGHRSNPTRIKVGIPEVNHLHINQCFIFS